MDIAIAGSSGFIGTALTNALRDGGHRVRPLLRPSSPPHPDGIRWDPDGATIDQAALEGVDAIVNLAGESIGASRWTAAFRERIRGSRVRSTRVLARAIAAMDRKPGVFVSSSASGYYGERGEEVVDESTPAGDGFLPSLCVEWEQAAAEAGDVRTVITRTAVVLDPRGGLMEKMMLPFRFGLGATLGDGSQWFPWVTLDDHVRAIQFLIEREDATGAYNVCSPNPVRNKEFTTELARSVNRPAFLAIPGFVLRAAFTDDAANEAFLVSQRMVPSRLASAGFEFTYPFIAGALRAVVGRAS